MDSSWTPTCPLARFLSLDETLYPPVDGLGSFRTVVLKRKGDARRLYDAVCVPVTTGKWKERWRGLCVSVGGSEDAEGEGEGGDVFGDDGEKDDKMDGAEEAENMEGEESERKSDIVVKKDEEETERWRMNPVFMKGEVTMTSLGEFIIFIIDQSYLHCCCRRSGGCHWCRF